MTYKFYNSPYLLFNTTEVTWFQELSKFLLTSTMLIDTFQTSPIYYFPLTVLQLRLSFPSHHRVFFLSYACDTFTKSPCDNDFKLRLPRHATLPQLPTLSNAMETQHWLLMRRLSKTSYSLHPTPALIKQDEPSNVVKEHLVIIQQACASGLLDPKTYGYGTVEATSLISHDTELSCNYNVDC